MHRIALTALGLVSRPGGFAATRLVYQRSGNARTPWGFIRCWLPFRQGTKRAIAELPVLALAQACFGRCCQRRAIAVSEPGNFRQNAPNAMLKRAARNLLFRFGYILLSKDEISAYFPEAKPGDLDMIERCRPFTMTGTSGLWGTLSAARYVARANIPGAIVECGVWRGGSMMMAALALMEDGASRDLFLYDTFEGMAKPGDMDKDYTGASALDLWNEAQRRTPKGWINASLEDVSRNLASTGYPREKIRLVPGRVEATLCDPNNLPNEIALLRLDTDWYDSTKAEMEVLYPRLVRGGVLIIDDYGYWQGARKAVDEYLEKTGTKLLLVPVNFAVRIAIKP
jgi:hypothetical protein